MADVKDSIWLGTNNRELARKAMWVMTILTIGLSLWLIVGDMISVVDVDLRSLLHPTENMWVMATVASAVLALILAGVYFSDFQGMIEPLPEGFMDIFSLILSRISMIGIVAIVSIMSYEVISRYIFEAPTLWANEAALWAAGFLFLFAGLYSMQQRSHIRIYIIYDMFPRWLQKASDLLSLLFLWIFTISLFWGAYGEALDKFQRMEVFGTAWDPPIPGTIKAAILLFVLLVAIQALSNLIADWHKEPESHTPLDDIDEGEIELLRKMVQD